MEINEEVKINSKTYLVKSVGKTKAILECEGKTFPIDRVLLEGGPVKDKSKSIDKPRGGGGPVSKAKVIRTTSEVIYIRWNGKEYGLSSHLGISPKELEAGFNEKLKISVAEAIKWINARTKVVVEPEGRSRNGN